MNINILKLSSHYAYHQFSYSEIMCFANIAFMCFAWISEQIAIISLYSTNLPVFYNGDEKCLLRGTDWVFKSDRHSFVLKGLIVIWCQVYILGFIPDILAQDLSAEKKFLFLTSYKESKEENLRYKVTLEIRSLLKTENCRMHYRP